MNRNSRSTTRLTLALAVGYAALAGATLSAYAAPATGFEISIYEGTPLAVWMSLGVALTLSLLVSFSVPGTRLGRCGVALGGGSVGVILALPLVRGYFFYGTGDGLTHVGWVRDVTDGVLNPLGLFYPGVHTATIAIATVAGIEPTRAMLFVVCALALSFLAFVPLCVRAITGRTDAAYVGAFVAFCFLPLNHIATHYMEPHPITEAILFSPVVVFLVVQYVLCDRSIAEAPVTRVGVLLALSSVALVFYHPQQAANALIVFATIAGIQAGCRLFRCGGEIRTHRPLYGQSIWLACFFTGWVTGRDTFFGAVNGVTRELAGYLLSGTTNAGAVVSQRGSSLGAIGASTSELFVKILLVPSLFAALVAGLVIVSLLGRNETTEPESTALLRYVSATLIVLVPYSLVFFVGSISKLFFRNLGFVMVFVTIAGAISLYRLTNRLAERFSATVVYPATTLLLGAALVLSMVVVFPSPYIYLGSGHVTDDRLAGYDLLFSHQAPDTEIYGVREGPWRYRQATAGVAGTETSRHEQRVIWGENLTRARTLAGEDRYFVLTRPDVVRETNVYDGLRYSNAQFRSLNRQPGIHLVQTNNAVTVYRIEALRPPADRDDPGSPSLETSAGPTPNPGPDSAGATTRTPRSGSIASAPPGPTRPPETAATAGGSNVAATATTNATTTTAATTNATGTNATNPARVRSRNETGTNGTGTNETKTNGTPARPFAGNADAGNAMGTNGTRAAVSRTARVLFGAQTRSPRR